VKHSNLAEFFSQEFIWKMNSVRLTKLFVLASFDINTHCRISKKKRRELILLKQVHLQRIEICYLGERKIKEKHTRK